MEYKPKAVFFTGGAGFIGSNTLVHMVQTYPDTKFVCLDKLTNCATKKNFKEIVDCPNFTFVKGDINATDLVTHLIEIHKIDTIMHFAAETHVDNSFGQSLAFTTTNVLGTHSILEAAKAHLNQIKRFIHVSTDEVYGESQKQDARSTELASLSPTNPYAATKCSAEFLVKSYHKSFGLPIIITRGNNVYGPKQYPEKLIPKFICLLDQKKPCYLHGDGSNRRSFLYVTDVVNAFEIILKKGKIGQIYNIGSDYEISNKEVLLHLLDLFKLPETDYVRFCRDRAFNDFRYHISTSSLEKLGWKQTVDFNHGIELTRDWYLTHRDHWIDISRALLPHPQSS